MFQYLDYGLFAIMLVSGLFALSRGLMRELLSIAAWAGAGYAAYQAMKMKRLTDLVAPYLDPSKPWMAQAAVAVAVFIGLFILLQVAGLRLGNRVVNSGVGAFDRTLGFFFGLARGLVLVAICFMFYGWRVAADKQEDWVRNARSLPLVRATAEAIRTHLPSEIAETLANTSIIGNGPDDPGAQPADAKPAEKANDKSPGYTNSQQQGMDNLVKGKTKQ